MRTTKPKLSEADIQQQVWDFLTLDGWHVLRTELTVQRDRGRVVGERGMPDIQAIRYGGNGDGRPNLWTPSRVHAQVMWLEIKKPGADVSKVQHAWHAVEVNRGGFVMVVRDFNGFRNWYVEASGLNRSIRNQSTNA